MLHECCSRSGCQSRQLVEPEDDGMQPIDPRPFAALVNSRSFLHLQLFPRANPTRSARLKMCRSTEPWKSWGWSTVKAVTRNEASKFILPRVPL
jgi:hypothetical protein